MALLWKISTSKNLNNQIVKGWELNFFQVLHQILMRRRISVFSTEKFSHLIQRTRKIHQIIPQIPSTLSFKNDLKPLKKTLKIFFLYEISSSPINICFSSLHPHKLMKSYKIVIGIFKHPKMRKTFRKIDWKRRREKEKLKLFSYFTIIASFLHQF